MDDKRVAVKLWKAKRHHQKDVPGKSVNIKDRKRVIVLLWTMKVSDSNHLNILVVWMPRKLQEVSRAMEGPLRIETSINEYVFLLNSFLYYFYIILCLISLVCWRWVQVR
jgi:hypothetical protein